jgi:hypothetical protein
MEDESERGQTAKLHRTLPRNTTYAQAQQELDKAIAEVNVNARTFCALTNHSAVYQIYAGPTGHPATPRS